jgi:hypothetical protein
MVLIVNGKLFLSEKYLRRKQPPSDHAIKVISASSGRVLSIPSKTIFHSSYLALSLFGKTGMSTVPQLPCQIFAISLVQEVFSSGVQGSDCHQT